MLRYLKATFKHLKKIMNKEVREGEKHQEISSPEERSLSRLRGRQKNVEASRIKQVKKSMEAKKAKKKHQHRHRSSPGEVDESDATPSYTHKEGSRWIKNNQLKTANNTKVFVKHQNKR